MHHTPTHTTHTILRIGASFCPPWGWSTSVECVCYCVGLVTPSHTFSSYVPSYALHIRITRSPHHWIGYTTLPQRLRRPLDALTLSHHHNTTLHDALSTPSPRPPPQPFGNTPSLLTQFVCGATPLSNRPLFHPHFTFTIAHNRSHTIDNV